MAGLSGYRDSYALLASSQKSGDGVPLYMRHVNRPLGRHAAALAAEAGVSPNQVTAASAAASLAAMVVLCLAAPTPMVAAVVAVLLIVAFALDSADGQLARLTGRGGPAGEWLDHVVDAARHQLFHLAILVSLVRFADVGEGALLLPLAFVVVASLRFFAHILADQLRRQRDATRAATHTAHPASGLRSLIQLPSDTGVLNLVVLLLPWTPVFVGAYAVLLILNFVLLCATLRRKHAELQTAAMALR